MQARWASAALRVCENRRGAKIFSAGRTESRSAGGLLWTMGARGLSVAGRGARALDTAGAISASAARLPSGGLAARAGWILARLRAGKLCGPNRARSGLGCLETKSSAVARRRDADATEGPVQAAHDISFGRRHKPNAAGTLPGEPAGDPTIAFAGGLPDRDRLDG